jgi:oligoendopeptidase F
MRLPHFFQLPCYFIEYALAALGAFSLYRAAQVDRAQAITALKRFMALGWSRPVDELYAEAGLRFDLSESGVKHVTDLVAEELGKR